MVKKCFFEPLVKIVMVGGKVLEHFRDYGNDAPLTIQKQLEGKGWERIFYPATLCCAAA